MLRGGGVTLRAAKLARIIFWLSSRTSRRERLPPPGTLRLGGDWADMAKRLYLHERLSKDDPNYDVVRDPTVEAWADSHGLVADAHAGRVSLPDYVEGCVK